MRYKLVMFGFSAVCVSLQEVRDRLKIYPSERFMIEGKDQCYLIDLQDGKYYLIDLDSQGKYVIKGLD
ncbi:MAG: hypothetical protein MR629_01200 [Helicobacter sp.]|nr:hypothetical protein [Helicobacter sp.]MCI7484664.1 hypothetical protein [Helicobacter sp.]MDD7567781.1 hypothetical protein [Helicobacter sp.]MDY5741088.1 hypothetical protein [Helicobacter sp.]